MKQSTIDKALSALDGMREIVRAEMLQTGNYVNREISNKRRARTGAICGGRKHCAIGALWVGAGIKPQVSKYGAIFLPGADIFDRLEFVRRRPGLGLALDTLNEAAAKFAQEQGTHMSRRYSDPIEALFEGSYGGDLTKRDLLSIIAAAKRRIKANAK